VWAQERCRISPPDFLAECSKRQLNHGSFVLLYFRLFTFSDLYWVCLSVFSGTVLFVSISQVIGCEDRLRNDLYCVEWGIKLYSNQPTWLLYHSLHLKHCLHSVLARTGSLLAVSSSGNLSVSVLQWLPLTQSSGGRQAGKWSCYQLVAAGQLNTTQCVLLLLQLTYPLHTFLLSPAVFLCKHCAAAVTLDTQNAVLPPAEWCKLSIA